MEELEVVKGLLKICFEIIIALQNDLLYEIWFLQFSFIKTTIWANWLDSRPKLLLECKEAIFQNQIGHKWQQL